MLLNNKLKDYRNTLNINQQEFEMLVNVSRQIISLIERGNFSRISNKNSNGI